MKGTPGYANPLSQSPFLLLFYPGADILAYPNDIANPAVRILDSHIYDTAVIRFPVKRHMYLDAPFAELLFDIIRKYNISPA